MAMTPLEPRLPRFTGWLRPVVDAVARRDASVHRKLLFGFLVGALLLVGMAVLSLVVIGRMNERVSDLDRLQDKASRAQQMLYAVTAQSHYRAMALLTGDDKYNGQIVDAKKTFVRLLDEMERADPADAALLRRLRAANDTYAFAESSAGRSRCTRPATCPGATRLHLERGAPGSHVLEASTADAHRLGRRRRWRRRRRRSTPTGRCSPTAVVAFSAVSVVGGAAARLRPVVGVHPARSGRWSARSPGSPPATSASASRCRTAMSSGSSPTTSTSTSERLAHAVRGAAARWPRRLERDERVAGARERGEVAVPGQREPRAADADERDPRLHRCAPRRRRRAAQPGADGVARMGPARWPRPARADQRDPRPVEDRGRQADHRAAAVRPARARRVGGGPAPLARRAEGDPLRLARHRRPGRGGARPPAGPPDPRQPARQRAEVHRRGRGRGRDERRGGRSFRVAVRDTGPGHRGRPARSDLRGVPPGRGRRRPAPAWGWRSAAGWPGRWAATSRSRASPGAGASFHLTLPLDCRSTRRRSSRPSPASAGDGERVLLSVDDDPSVAPLLQKMLAGHGYRVVASTERERGGERRAAPAARGDPARPPDARARRARHPARAQERPGDQRASR